MTKRVLFLTVMMAITCVLFAITFVWNIASYVRTSYEVYEGYVVDHTEDGLIIEVEVKVSPEEMIAYEPGDPYTIGGK